MNRIYLSVDYSEKNMAKAAGARWDDRKRSWYFPTPEPLDADAMAALPEALHEFANTNPEIVRDPYEVRKEHCNQMQTDLRASLDTRFAELLTELEEKPLDAYRPTWGDESDADVIRNTILKRLRDTGKQVFLDEISSMQDFPEVDVSQNFGYIMHSILFRMWNDTMSARWKAVSEPFYGAYFDCLDQLDLDALPHGDIQPGDKHLQGELEIEFDQCNIPPRICSIRNRGEVIFHDHEQSDITYGGKFIARATEHPKLRDVNRQLSERYKTVIREWIADIVIDDDAPRSRDSENYTIQARDGRQISGFVADDWYFILRISDKELGDIPEKEALSERIKQVFEQKV